jgi:hypothetical protein
MPEPSMSATASAPVGIDVGASRRRGSIGGEFFRNILAADFAGAAYPVNLKAKPVAGVRAYASIEEIHRIRDRASRRTRRLTPGGRLVPA